MATPVAMPMTTAKMRLACAYICYSIATMNIENKSGPSTDPFGTPAFTDTVLDDMLYITTN